VGFTVVRLLEKVCKSQNMGMVLKEGSFIKYFANSDIFNRRVVKNN